MLALFLFLLAATGLSANEHMHTPAHKAVVDGNDNRVTLKEESFFSVTSRGTESLRK